MPAESISLNNEYNARLRRMLYDLDHVDIINHQPQMLGGGSPYPQKIALPGNSGQYPPIQMLSEYKAMGGAAMGAKVKEKAEKYIKKFKDEASDVTQDTLTKMKPVARRKVKELADKYLEAEEDHEAARDARKGGSHCKKGAGVGKFLKNVANLGLEKVKDVKIGDIVKGYKDMGGAKPKRTNARAVVVKKVMADRGLGMIAASKYVKEHNLY